MPLGLMHRPQRAKVAKRIQVGQFSLRVLTVEDLLERATEMYVTQRVDQRIARRVEIAEPDRRRVDRIGYAVITPGDEQEENEVRQPGEREHADEHAELPRGFQLLLHGTGEARIDDVIKKCDNIHFRRLIDRRGRKRKILVITSVCCVVDMSRRR